MGTSFFMLLGTGILLTLALRRSVHRFFRCLGASAQTMPYANTYIALLSARHRLCDDKPGDEQLHQCSRIWQNRDAHCFDRGNSEHSLGPHLYLRTRHGGERGCACDCDLTGHFRTLGASFLTGKKALLRLRLAAMRPALEHLKEILALGMSGFVMYISTSIVQIVCNVSLARYGGDLYIGVMTVLTSIREIVYTPLTGLTNGAQP